MALNPAKIPISDHELPISIFEQTFNQAAVGMAHIGFKGDFFRANQKFCSQLGYSQEQLLSKTLEALLHPEDAILELAGIERLLTEEISEFTAAHRYFKKNGQMLWGFITVSIVKSSNDTPLCLIYTLSDITEKIQAEYELNQLKQDLEQRIQEQTQVLNSTLQRKFKIKAELSEERQNLKSIANHLPALIASLDETLCFTFNNKTFATWFNIPEDQVGQPIEPIIGDKAFHYLVPYFNAVLAGKKVSCELTLHSRYGEVYVQVILIPCNGLNQARFHCFMLNITEQKQLQDQYEFEASHDMLTGLPNRRAFMKRLTSTLNPLSPPLNLAVIFIDIDNFKEINDHYGHETGDHALIQVANILKNDLYNEGVAARLAGDEFVVLVRNLQRPNHALAQLCAHILTAVNAINLNLSNTPKLSVSIGATLVDNFDDQLITSKEILAKADLAMYQAKSQGKNCYQIS